MIYYLTCSKDITLCSETIALYIYFDEGDDAFIFGPPTQLMPSDHNYNLIISAHFCSRLLMSAEASDVEKAMFDEQGYVNHNPSASDSSL